MVGSAWTEWVRPIITVSASARAPGDQGDEQPVGVDQEALAGRPELERQGGVDDVAARQAEVQVAAVGPDALGDLADERDDVVIGRLLDLGDPADIDASPRLDRGQGAGRDQAAGRPGHGPPRARPGASPRSAPGRTRSRPSRRACSAGSCRRPGRDGGTCGRRIGGDIVAALQAVEMDRVGQLLGHGPGRGEVGAAADDGQDAPAVVRRVPSSPSAASRTGRRGRRPSRHAARRRRRR